MLFNSYEFLLVFLPVVVLGYFGILRWGYGSPAKLFLIAASLFFYSWWDVRYLPIIVLSMIFNYCIGRGLHRSGIFSGRSRSALLGLGISANLGLLGYFKYADFFLANFNKLTGAHHELLGLALPLAISFFTFQQIAFLVDTYRAEASEYDFLNYALFVSFFPQLIAGPIVHHKQMMPQFVASSNKGWDYRNAAAGLFILSIGLFKKVAIADTFAQWATPGFDQPIVLGFIDAWSTSLSYTFQLYFDFSGYTDMAIGLALLFNIRLPLNFNSPYKAASIQDFWRRWHMTLSNFLRDYLYIPLGGNRRGLPRVYVNLMITFILGGLWHGAGWNFVFWGFLHGFALVCHRLWQQLGLHMQHWLAWFITFNFVNVAWVFFRAKTWGDALRLLRGMTDFQSIQIPAQWSQLFVGITSMHLALIAALFAVVLLPNSQEITAFSALKRWRQLGVGGGFAYGLLFFVGLLVLSLSTYSEFVYFNF